MKRSLLLYIITVLLITAFSYIFVDKNLFYLKNIYTGFATSERLLVVVLLISSFVMLSLWYIYLILNYKKNKLPSRNFLYLICANFPFLFSYPAMLSFDIFNYLATAKVTFFYHENPYVIMPIEFLGDPLLLFMHAANKTALYGPLWILLTGIPFLLGLHNFIVTLFLFKLFILLFYIFLLFTIYKLTQNYFSVLLFALHPLVLVETLISGHNDVVMMSLALYAFYLLKKRKLLFGLFFLCLSILIKFATLFLLPLFLYISYRIYKKKNIDWSKMFLLGFILMLSIFLLSAFREEIYPWYAIWFLSFVVLITEYKRIYIGSLILSFSLLFRYFPFIYWGIYDQRTMIFKTFVTFFPIILYIIYVFIKKFDRH